MIIYQITRLNLVFSLSKQSFHRPEFICGKTTLHFFSKTTEKHPQGTCHTV